MTNHHVPAFFDPRHRAAASSRAARSSDAATPLVLPQRIAGDRVFRGKFSESRISHPILGVMGFDD